MAPHVELAALRDTTAIPPLILAKVNCFLKSNLIFQPENQKIITDLMNDSTDTTGWITNAAGTYMNTCNGKTFFGGYPNFGKTVYAWKNYTELPLPHYQVSINVQLFFIDSWDDETYYVKVDDTIVYQEMYYTSNGEVDYCGRSGNYKDQIKTVTSNPLAHIAPSLVLNFTNNLDESGSDESFGFNNIQIIVDLCHPACSACTGPSNADCSSCNSGWYLEGTTCNTTCSLPGKYANSTTNKCEGIKHDSFSWINIFKYSM